LLVYDGGVVIDGGTVEVSCASGVGACSRQGRTQCSAGALVCSAMPASPMAESCNGTDDDCDGTTDEGTLCSVSGQSCVAGSCTCPVGQTVCGTSCVELGGSCTVGVGACQATGTYVCGAGERTCSATAKAPQTEICDEIDNDCNGIIDNDIEKVECYPDEDNDFRRTNDTVTRHCRDNSRGEFGYCPTGYVVTYMGFGLDCDPANSSRYDNRSMKKDADNDSYCVGAEFTECSGNLPPSGSRFVNTCAPENDCNDSERTLLRNLPGVPDQDGDGYCTSFATQMVCSGQSLPSGYRTAATCNATLDCDPLDRNRFANRDVRIDVDGDSYCRGTPASICTGAQAPPGTKFSEQCQTTNDCKDTNPYANVFCAISSMFRTNRRGRDCVNTNSVVQVQVQQQCTTPGFTTVGALRASRVAGSGDCTNPRFIDSTKTAVDVDTTCNFLEGPTCEVVADCLAD
jgi:hypothetical protein